MFPVAPRQAHHQTVARGVMVSITAHHWGARGGARVEAVHSVADLRGMLLSGVSLGWVLPGRPLLFVVPPPHRPAPCLRRPASPPRRGWPAGTPSRPVFPLVVCLPAFRSNITVTRCRLRVALLHEMCCHLRFRLDT